jgi:hypothetical protein
MIRRFGVIFPTKEYFPRHFFALTEREIDYAVSAQTM